MENNNNIENFTSMEGDDWKDEFESELSIIQQFALPASPEYDDRMETYFQLPLVSNRIPRTDGTDKALSSTDQFKVLLFLIVMFTNLSLLVFLHREHHRISKMKRTRKTLSYQSSSKLLQTAGSNNNQSRKPHLNYRVFLQSCFIASLAIANIIAGVGVILRLALPYTLLPFLCNEFPVTICLQIARLEIMVSLCGCSLDHCLAILYPLLHHTRASTLTKIYTMSTIATWILTIILATSSLYLPFRMKGRCAESEVEIGQWMSFVDFSNVRAFCSAILCNHNYIIETIQLAIVTLIAFIILICYIKVFYFLIKNHHHKRKSFLNMRRSDTSSNGHSPRVSALQQNSHEISPKSSPKQRGQPQYLIAQSTPVITQLTRHSSSHNHGSLKGVYLTALIILSCTMAWIPHLIIEVVATYISFQSENNKEMTNVFLSETMKYTEVSLLVIYPPTYNIFFVNFFLFFSLI